jgi:branched-chain amino acid transport system substrate-binding protein
MKPVRFASFFYPQIVYMTKTAMRWPSAVLLAVLSSLIASAPVMAVPGVTTSTVVLGQSAALTGNSKTIGTEMRDGALAYFDYINSKGGVAGRKIVLKTLDDEFKAERAAKNTEELLQGDGTFALFGYTGTPAALAALPLVERKDVPFFAPFSGADSVHGSFNRNVFNIRAGYSLEMVKIIENLEAIGIKKIAVLYPDDVYGKAGLAAVEKALKKRNLTVMGSATVERGSTDVSAAVAKMRAMQPPAVIIISAYTSSAAFIRAMRKDAISLPYFWNISSVGGHALATTLGAEARGVMISQVMPSPWNTKLPVVKEYTRLYLGKPGREAGFVSLEGFMAAKAFVEGLERAGANLTRPGFVKAVESMHHVDIGGYVLKFSATEHDASDFVDLTVIRNDGSFMN